MAYLDNNGVPTPTGSGDDPIAAADRELEELRKTLGELEEKSAAQAPTEAAPAVDEPEETAPAAERAEKAEPITATSRAYTPARTAPDSGKPKTFIIVIALIVAFIGLTVGVLVFLMTRPVVESRPEQETPRETVTINDSVLGTVEISPAEGATVNTYEEENLIKGGDGYYAYYENGKKVSEMGMDLSEFQGDVDFSAVKSSGIDFVMLRIGGRYYSDEGRLYSDSAFETYYEQAKAAGLKVGAYFFSQAASTEDAIEEARYALELLNGRKLDYPVALDWETIENDYARTDSVSGETLTELAKAFCDTIEGGGYKSIVYASTSLMLQSYDFETMKDYEFWLADYREFPDSEKMYYDFTMWQYTTDGYADGVDGAVDLNLCLRAY